MTTYIIRRLVQAFFVLIIVTLLVFLAMHLLPGDPILIFVSSGELKNTSSEEIEALRQQFGLDRPLLLQYVDWLAGVARGDFGISITHRRPVMDEISRRLPITFQLSALALVISTAIGLPAGVVCAVRRGKWVDTIVTVLANAGITIPVFWLGIMLIYLFALKMGWLPVQGFTPLTVDFWKGMRQMVMPVFCLSIFSISSTTRQTRSSMLEVMRQDYIRTAWAKGLKERVVIMKHGLKNGLIPIVTLLGMSFSFIVGGSVLIENVFNIPGMSRLMVNAVFVQDYPIVQGFVLLIAVTILLTNLIVDISYGWLDPRIRYG
ncbi:MAG: peptide ABC transporter [Chloroflexi bacterium RBG_16_56_11]|nr:MAG: peptide ABC transporter [Chloroflexi bacterium RBG_16_56_11]